MADSNGLAVDEAVDLILCDPGDRLAGEICVLIHLTKQAKLSKRASTNPGSAAK